MESNDFTKCCQAVEEGAEIYVENLGTHERGRIVFCTGTEFDVRVGGKRQHWGPEGCEEVSSCSESPHKNI